MSNKIPRPGGPLPTYVVGKPKKSRTVTKQSFQSTLDTAMQAGYGSKNYTQKSPRVNTGTPGTQRYVQRDYTYGGTTVKDGTVLTSRSAKRTTSKRPVGPTR
jgi:hypothetical protein